jgi:glycosyltransferase involved in cell wall biosynthesis
VHKRRCSAPGKPQESRVATMRRAEAEIEATGQPDPPGKRVAILLAVFNGEDFLASQLETLARQTVAKLDVWTSDDGSTDSSRDILKRFATDWTKGSFRILNGPRAGFAENFRSLMGNREIEADYVAFCDQDDLWDEDKLADAISWLEKQGDECPSLFCTRTRTITVEGKEAGFSPLFMKPPGFRNAIIQSVAGANTMVMNRAAWDLVREASRRTAFVSHDWWCYLVVTGAGGLVRYSPEARIGYRQHQGNLVGENNSWRARMSRLRHLMKGRFARWNEQNLAALSVCEDLLAPDARETMRLFAAARTGGLPQRISALLRAGLYRQTFFGQVGLYVACILKRL